MMNVSALRKRNSGASQLDSEPNVARLQQLSDEVGRIADTLAALSAVPNEPEPDNPAWKTGEAPAVSLETVRQVIRARRLRARYFDKDLFADPAWDMMLDLLQAELAQRRVPVTSLCLASGVPATTALRWIHTMTVAGLFLRRPDPHDRRRMFIELSPSASFSLRQYFNAIGNAAAT